MEDVPHDNGDMSKMDNEIQQIILETEVQKSEIEQKAVLSEPKKSRRNLRSVAFVVVTMLCLCSIIGLVLSKAGMNKIEREREPIEALLDTFMKNAEAKDTESAFALFSPRAQRQMSITNIEELIEGNNYTLFENYENITIQEIRLNVAANTNPDVPQGTVADVTAIVFYTDDFEGKITAILEKADDEWKIHFVNVVVPPDKFQP